jgi:hypothetical protein
LTWHHVRRCRMRATIGPGWLACKTNQRAGISTRRGQSACCSSKHVALNTISTAVVSNLHSIPISAVASMRHETTRRKSVGVVVDTNQMTMTHSWYCIRRQSASRDRHQSARQLRSNTNQIIMARVRHRPKHGQAGQLLVGVGWRQAIQHLGGWEILSICTFTVCILFSSSMFRIDA